MKRKIFGIIIATIIIGVMVYGFSQWRLKQPIKQNPPAVEQSAVTAPQTSVSPPPSQPQLPESFLIAGVPFTSQAPDANWDAVHEETCEEAAVLVTAAYFRGDRRESIPAVEAEKELQEIIVWEKEKFGFFEDTTVNQVSQIITEKYGLNVAVRTIVTGDDLKKILSEKKLILAPTAGRFLKNPYFRQPGPIYHMVVIIGWDNDEFIVQDVGTKRGRHYKYPASTLINAIHDLYDNATPPLDAEKILTGAKRIIVVTRDSNQ